MYYWKTYMLVFCIQRLFVTFHCWISSFTLAWVGLYYNTSQPCARTWVKIAWWVLALWWALGSYIYFWQTFSTLYCECIIIIADFVLPCSGHVPGLPTELKPTLHTALVQVATPMGVVFLIGEDAEEPDTSKIWLSYLCLHHMTLACTVKEMCVVVTQYVGVKFAHSWVCTCCTAGQIWYGTLEHMPLIL